MPTLPALFVSHGSPMMALEDGRARRFLASYAGELPRPRAILVASAHWETAAPRLTASAAPPTIHDFGGFPEALYRMRYPAPGEPALAERAADLLQAAGLAAALDPTRGLDHGAWIPLQLLYPAADIPIVQLSLQSHLGAAHHYAMGVALRPLRDEGVLVIGSGSASHNLTALDRRAGDTATPPPWVDAFDQWVADKVATADTAALLAWQAEAPYAHQNHPSDEHFLPLFVALGAGAPDAPGARIHHSHTYGALSMDAYR
ncbi:MAG: dioxygenase, partial [Proteobacteria bacterium]|nr:dioxygenase [Pseudomonadota bacterium]